MNKLIPSCLLFCVAVTGCGETDMQLQGPDAVSLPALAVPFLSSQTFVRTGEREAATGDCLFDTDFRVDAGELAPGETKLRIQRAFDPVRCEELVEEGVVRDVSKSLGDVDNAPGLISAGQQYSSTGRISYVDTGSFLGTVLTPLLDGLDVSHVAATINLTSGDCRNSAPMASVGFNIGSETLMGWLASRSSSWYELTCSRVVAEAAVTHSNNGSKPLLYDCSDGAHITYNNFRMTMTMGGQRALSGRDRIWGDNVDCRENIVRVQTLD